MGTSTCDILTVPGEDMGAKLVRGICGQVDGSVIPGMIGMEAGQSAFGDIYAWFRDLLSWPLAHIQGQVENGRENQQFIKEISDRIIPELSKAAERIPVEASGIVALDWLNGRRTPDANQHLTGVITGLSLGSNAPKIFKALVEATAFGAKKIIDRFRDEGIRIDEVIALGGVTKKSPLVMQTIADVLNMEIKVVRSEQTVALGAAMFAATVAGLFDSVEAAQKAMGQGFEKTYRPIPRHVNHYQDLFKAYSTLGDLIEFHF
ncbi:MAG: FGGY-family carbohydrate kinase [bacterium]